MHLIQKFRQSAVSPQLQQAASSVLCLNQSDQCTCRLPACLVTSRSSATGILLARLVFTSPSRSAKRHALSLLHLAQPNPDAVLMTYLMTAKAPASQQAPPSVGSSMARPGDPNLGDDDTSTRASAAGPGGSTSLQGQQGASMPQLPASAAAASSAARNFHRSSSMAAQSSGGGSSYTRNSGSIASLSEGIRELMSVPAGGSSLPGSTPVTPGPISPAAAPAAASPGGEQWIIRGPARLIPNITWCAVAEAGSPPPDLFAAAQLCSKHDPKDAEEADVLLDLPGAEEDCGYETEVVVYVPSRSKTSWLKGCRRKSSSSASSSMSTDSKASAVK
jgi:hypothetical protein